MEGDEDIQDIQKLSSGEISNSVQDKSDFRSALLSDLDLESRSLEEKHESKMGRQEQHDKKMKGEDYVGEVSVELTRDSLESVNGNEELKEEGLAIERLETDLERMEGNPLLEPVQKALEQQLLDR